MKRLFATGASTLMLMAAPAAAFAVNVSSDDGSGTQSVNNWYEGGASLTGTLKSTAGNPVYYSGVRVYDNSLDENDGRYDSNVTSTTAVAHGGFLGTTANVATKLDGVKVRICRDRSGLPDPCGSYSATMRR